MSGTGMSRALLERLPLYLHYLRDLPSDAGETISAPAIARALSLGEVQVRKDLAQVSGTGKPRVGYRTEELIGHLEDCLGCKTTTQAILAGAGRLGRALLEYDGFAEYGIEIAAAFDRDSDRLTAGETGGQVLPIGELTAFCARREIRIGIITVPEAEAQTVCDLMVSCGIAAIWNFAPARLRVPDRVLVRNENMASSLALLSGYLGR